MARPRKTPPPDIQDPRKKELDHSCLEEYLTDARRVRRWFERDWMLNLAYVQNEQSVEYAVETGRLVDRARDDDALYTRHNVMNKIVRIERAIRSIGEIGRVHVCRFGDGGEHLHWWFLARPARIPQLIGSFAAIWDDILPPTPEPVWRANIAAVVSALEQD